MLANNALSKRTNDKSCPPFSSDSSPEYCWCIYTPCRGGNAMHMARTYDMHLQHAQVYHNGQDVKKYQGVKRDLMKMMHLQDIMYS